MLAQTNKKIFENHKVTRRDEFDLDHFFTDQICNLMQIR